MRKSLIGILCSLALAGGLCAQNPTPTPSGASIIASPQTTTATPGGSFKVDFSLLGTAPPAISGFYDMYLVTGSANSGLFTITASTPTGPFNATGPSLGGGDALNVAAASGFVRNNLDLGYSGTTQSAPYNFNLQTLTIQVSNSALPGIYTFSTSTFANSGQFYSDLADANPNANGAVYALGAGTFQIQVVPEPATWSLLAFGGSAALGFLRARRRS